METKRGKLRNFVNDVGCGKRSCMMLLDAILTIVFVLDIGGKKTEAAGAERADAGDGGHPEMVVDVEVARIATEVLTDPRGLAAAVVAEEMADGAVLWCNRTRYVWLFLCLV
jgi:hypothetical protein